MRCFLSAIAPWQKFMKTQLRKAVWYSEKNTEQEVKEIRVQVLATQQTDHGAQGKSQVNLGLIFSVCKGKYKWVEIVNLTNTPIPLIGTSVKNSSLMKNVQAKVRPWQTGGANPEKRQK